MINHEDYFVCAHSGQGFINLLKSNIAGIDKGYLLTGACPFVKHKMLKDIADIYEKKGYFIEKIHSCWDKDELDGVLIRSLKLGFINSELLTKTKDKLFSNTHIIDTDILFAKEYKIHENASTFLRTEAKQLYKKTYDLFANAIAIHDEWEEIYIKEMNFAAADSYTKDFIKALYANAPQHKNGVTRHRFFGGATYEGSVDFVPELLKTLDKCYYIKGRPGSGKSTLLTKIQAQAETLGYDVEVYHCGFDTKSLDMIRVPELHFGIFDSTAPHEYFPEKESDIVIDMYEKFITSGTDQKEEIKLAEIRSRYQEQIAAGITLMTLAHSYECSADALFIHYLDERKYALLLKNMEV